jgi:peptidoglycan hydrolase-like protein with peptidoglycan-binding domain
MRKRSLRVVICAAAVITAAVSAQAMADEITQRIQKDLVALGYDPGNIKGDATDETTAAIAQFQAERDMPVTGAVSPLLAGILSAEVSKQRNGTAAPAASAAAAPAAPVQDAAALQAAQQACLQKKMQDAQDAAKKKRAFGRLMSAVTRTAGQMGNYDVSSTVSNIYAAGATVGDLAAAAKDLGLTEDDVAACQHP